MMKHATFMWARGLQFPVAYMSKKGYNHILTVLFHACDISRLFLTARLFHTISFCMDLYRRETSCLKSELVIICFDVSSCVDFGAGGE